MSPSAGCTSYTLLVMPLLSWTLDIRKDSLIPPTFSITRCQLAPSTSFVGVSECSVGSFPCWCCWSSLLSAGKMVDIPPQLFLGMPSPFFTCLYSTNVHVCDTFTAISSSSIQGFLILTMCFFQIGQVLEFFNSWLHCALIEPRKFLDEEQMALVVETNSRF